MSDPALYTRDEQIRDISAHRHHLVILGAGSSVAACPAGDKYGRKLPVMLDLVDTLGPSEPIEQAGLRLTADFEQLYATLAASPEHSALCRLLEQRIADYFKGLQLLTLLRSMTIWFCRFDPKTQLPRSTGTRSSGRPAKDTMRSLHCRRSSFCTAVLWLAGASPTSSKASLVSDVLNAAISTARPVSCIR